MKRQRIEYIDIAKGIGIILVVIGHCINGSSFIGRWIWSFHMPLFFILSGMCFDLTRNTLFVPFVIKKIKSLLFPLIEFSILMVLMKSLIFPHTFNTSSMRNSFPDVAYWFIFILFLSEILFFIVSKITYNRLIKLTFLFICLFIGKLLNIYNINFVYNLSSIWVCIFFYGFGNIFRTEINSILNSEGTKYKNIIISIIVLLIPVISTHYINKTIDLRINNIPYPMLYHVFISIIGTIGILLISKILSVYNNLVKSIMIYAGKNSLIILLLHMFYISLCVKLVSPLVYNKITYKIIEIFCISILLYLSIYFINNKAKWIIGKF